MKNQFIITLTTLSLLLFSISYAAQGDIAGENLTNLKFEQLATHIKINDDAVKEIRRDQLNYKIEKDILKETYSSNIQTINILIAIVLGLFTIIGFLGVKGIASIKNEFNKELDEIKILKSKYELKFIEIEKEQSRAKEDYEELKTSNEDQENRLKILEIQEKAGSFINNKNYTRALSYLLVGLELEPKDMIMLGQKQHCHIKLKNYAEAINTGEILFKNDPDNVSIILNQCELYLITKNIDEYDKLVEKYKAAIAEREPIYMIWYFESIKFLQKKDLEGLKKHFQNLVSTKIEPSKSRRLNWDFADIKEIMASVEPVELNNFFAKIILFLEGGIETAEVIV